MAFPLRGFQIFEKPGPKGADFRMDRKGPKHLPTLSF